METWKWWHCSFGSYTISWMWVTSEAVGLIFVNLCVPHECNPQLQSLATDVALHRPADIRTVLASYQGHDIPSEFIERSKEHQR